MAIWRFIARYERDGVQVGYADRTFDEGSYKDDVRKTLEAAGQLAGNVMGEALSQAYDAAGIEQFPQGGRGDEGDAARAGDEAPPF